MARFSHGVESSSRFDLDVRMNCGSRFLTAMVERLLGQSRGCLAIPWRQVLRERLDDMRIKTQFFTIVVLFGVLLAVIGTSLVSTARGIAHLDREEETAIAIGRGASELTYLSSEYLLYREDEQRQRWESRWRSVSQDVSRLSPNTPEERTIASQIMGSLTRTKAVFEDVGRGLRDAPRPSGGGGSDSLFQVSWSRLAVQNQSTVFDSLRLSRLLRDQKHAVTQNNVTLISVMLPLFALFFVANYVIVYRRALRSLGQLRAGTKIVGSGDLDYVIPVTRNDEIGELTRAFNRMTVDLKGVTASKTELESEVAERHKAETALRDSVRRIEVISEARERDLETQRLLLQAAEALAELTELNLVLEVLADIVLASTAHTRVAVSLWDERRQELQLAVTRGSGASDPPQGRTAWADISGPAQEAIQTMRPRVIDYDALPQEQTGSATATGARLGLVVPLVSRQRVVGIVRVDDPGERRGFVESETALIQGIAAQAAVAIENSRMYGEEHRVADALRAIFQRPAPDITGIDLGVVGSYASDAEKVGGDFYDALALADRVCVLVGDVAGKGVAAVGLTESVRSAFRALAYASGTLSPSYLLGHINASLVRQLPAGEFVTAVLLTIDPRTGAYAVASAGHTLPVVCGHSCRELEVPSGPPLGVIECAYEEASGIIAPDEMILLYTDGVTEARRDSEFYGEERLLELLGNQGPEPKSAAQALFADVREFARGRLEDDLLIVALRRDSNSSVAAPSAE